MDIFTEPTEAPSKEPQSQGPKAWAIAVAVVVPLVIVGLGLVGLIWWKFRTPSKGYTKHDDEE